MIPNPHCISYLASACLWPFESNLKKDSQYKNIRFFSDLYKSISIGQNPYKNSWNLVHNMEKERLNQSKKNEKFKNKNEKNNFDGPIEPVLVRSGGNLK